LQERSPHRHAKCFKKCANDNAKDKIEEKQFSVMKFTP
jgi:hypothetical protein